ncbi:hypothetical protein AB7M16_003363 [Bradyrhizobium sp. USDA 372]
MDGATKGDGAMQKDIVRDIANRPVDCSIDEWKLNTPGHALTLDWTKLERLPPPILKAAREYARSRIRVWAPPTVRGLFYMYELLAKCPGFEQFDGTMRFSAFEELRQDRRAGSAELTRFRNWYRWSAASKYPGFDNVEAGLLKRIKIRANPHGRTARKKDPNQGPLTDRERQDLFDKALGASDEDLDLDERVAILLGMSLGTNSGPLSLLQVQDYCMETAGATTYHILMVPRHKKRLPKERMEFRPRQIDGDWAPYLQRLIDRNRAMADGQYRAWYGRDRPAEVAIPIFMRDEKREDLTPSMSEYALHLTPLEFSQLLQRASDRLDAHSRDGNPLRLNQRRFRSTFVTNLIASGKSARAVADALDHLSTGAIKHYEYANHRIVEKLDVAVGDAMKLVAGTFLGNLVEKSSEADRHRPASSRIPYFDRENDRGEDLGNCGSSGGCGRAMPYACYVCPQFEPWIGAPHERLLAQLEADRDRRKHSKMDPRMVAIQDATMDGVRAVIADIKKLNSGAE